MKKKLFLISSIVILFTAVTITVADNIKDTSDTAIEQKYSKKNYPIKKHHEKLNFDCATCHGEGSKDTYSDLSTKDCMDCHKDYKSLAERTEDLGYDDNIHASPHYPDMDCTLCHSSHKETTNYCVMCHSQDSMKNIKVP